MNIGLRGIKLTHFDIDYGDENTKTFAKVIFKELSTKVNKLDIENNALQCSQCISFPAQILMPTFIFRLRMPILKTTKEPEVSKTSDKDKAMKLLLGKLVLNDVKVNYNNTAIAPTKQGMDFNHLNFSK